MGNLDLNKFLRIAKRKGPIKYILKVVLLGEVNYKKGKREGITKDYYESGPLLMEDNIKNGKLEGISATIDSGYRAGKAVAQAIKENKTAVDIYGDMVKEILNHMNVCMEKIHFLTA